MQALTSMVSALKNKVDGQAASLAVNSNNRQQAATSNIAPAYGFVNPEFLVSDIDNSSARVSVATASAPASTDVRDSETPASSARSGNISIAYGDTVIENPFLLPPVKGPIEKKLESVEFLDFEDLMPMQTASTGGGHG